MNKADSRTVELDITVEKALFRSGSVFGNIRESQSYCHIRNTDTALWSEQHDYKH